MMQIGMSKCALEKAKELKQEKRHIEHLMPEIDLLYISPQNQAVVVPIQPQKEGRRGCKCG